jgi:hypothetical protein
MPGASPPDGSPDPVEAEPDPYVLEDEQNEEAWTQRQRIEGGYLAPSRLNDLATDSFDDEREADYQDWITARDKDQRANYRECDTCGFALSEDNFPPIGSKHTDTCIDCLEGRPQHERVKRDPQATLKATRQTGFKPTIEIPGAPEDLNGLTWHLLRSPLDQQGLVLFTTRNLGMLLTKAQQDEPILFADRNPNHHSKVDLSENTLSVLTDLGFSDVIAAGTLPELDLPGHAIEERWHYIILAR